jgi:hypothetical protein
MDDNKCLKKGIGGVIRACAMTATLFAFLLSITPQVDKPRVVAEEDR